MEEKTNLPLLTQLKEYLRTRVTLLKYEAIDKGTSIISTIIVFVLILFFLLTGLLLLSIALVVYAANILHSWQAGIAVVTGFYVMVAICVTILRKPLQNIFEGYFLFKYQTHRPWKQGKPNRI